jgi:hypothetical protein
MRFSTAIFLLATLACVGVAFAQNQTIPGAGNDTAVSISQNSPMVQATFDFLVQQAAHVRDHDLRSETLDAIANPRTCIHHRAGVTDAKKNAILQMLVSQGLVDTKDDATFPGGLKAGVFPPVTNDGSSCPHLPQPFFSAPGSGFGGHHSYPGGLPIHETNNDVADVNLAAEYRGVYGRDHEDGSDVFIDQDIIVAAPIWHDWAKPIVFQWNADGTEFQELNFGGNGSTDAWGAAGNSKTGGHHIMSIAEAMARGLSPAFVITQASAHSAPTLGNEYKVVNWLRAAAIMAQIDPVAEGYLITDSKGNLRLPPLRKLGDVRLNDTGQTNLLAEYALHNLSDADFTYSIPAVTETQVILQQLAPEFGYSPSNVAVYNNKYRNVVLAHLSAERLLMLYSSQGLQAVRAELRHLKAEGVI